jgi:hypothetical protein
LGNELLGRKFWIFSIWTIRTNRIFYLKFPGSPKPRIENLLYPFDEYCLSK